MLVDLGPQRPRPGVRARHASRCADFFSVERYSHVMHLVSTVTGDAARRPQRLRRRRRVLPGRHAVRGAEAARDGDHRGAGADPARALRRHRRLPRLRRRTPTPRSPSARRWCATASPTCRRAAGSWPTPTRSRRTPRCLNKARAVLSRGGDGRDPARPWAEAQARVTAAGRAAAAAAPARGDGRSAAVAATVRRRPPCAGAWSAAAVCCAACWRRGCAWGCRSRRVVHGRVDAVGRGPVAVTADGAVSCPR